MKRTRNIIRYLIILILDIGMMVTLHSYINMLILVGLIVLPLYSIWAVHMVANSATLEIRLPLEPMNKGEEFILRFILHNSKLLPVLNVTIPLMVENRLYAIWGEHSLVIPARMKGTTEIKYPLVMENCGRFVVSAEYMKFTDLLGIYEKKVRIGMEKDCLIFPNGEDRNQQAGHIYNKGVTEAMESKEKGYDFSEVSGVREYIPGDKLQNIHWKLSVKKDDLMVKERISVSAQQLNVLVDIVNDDKMCLESILELADSITKAFVKQNLPFSVYYYSVNLGEMECCYIGNEIEQHQWMEGILLDHSYKKVGRIEECFLHEYPGSGTYLYIGCGYESPVSDTTVEGPNGTIAQLKTIG